MYSHTYIGVQNNKKYRNYYDERFIVKHVLTSVTRCDGDVDTIFRSINNVYEYYTLAGQRYLVYYKRRVFPT